MRRLRLLLLALMLCAAPAVAQMKTGPIGTLVTAQTGTATSTAFLRLDTWNMACFEYKVTGACSVKLQFRIGGGGTVLADMANSTFTADAAFCVAPPPVGEVVVNTSACAGSVTVKYHVGRQG